MLRRSQAGRVYHKAVAQCYGFFDWRWTGMFGEGMFFTIAELAHRWNCHPKTVWRMIRAGRLAAIRVGREWRIAESCVKHYEAQC